MFPGKIPTLKVSLRALPGGDVNDEVRQMPVRGLCHLDGSDPDSAFFSIELLRSSSNAAFFMGAGPSAPWTGLFLSFSRGAAFSTTLLRRAGIRVTAQKTTVLLGLEQERLVPCGVCSSDHCMTGVLCAHLGFGDDENGGWAPSKAEGRPGGENAGGETEAEAVAAMGVSLFRIA